MKIQWALILVIGSLLVFGCDKDDDKVAGTPISCSWFDADNCWRQSLEAANSCLWGTSSGGTLAGDGGSCSYTSGSTYDVTFYNPVIVAAPVDTDPWNYAVNKDSSFCMSYNETGSDTVLVTSVGTFRSTISGSTAILTCPDGAQYNISFNDYLSCALGGSFTPSTTTASGGSGFTFTFGGHPTVAPAFRCD